MSSSSKRKFFFYFGRIHGLPTGHALFGKDVLALHVPFGVAASERVGETGERLLQVDTSSQGKASAFELVFFLRANLANSLAEHQVSSIPTAHWASLPWRATSLLPARTFSSQAAIELAHAPPVVTPELLQIMMGRVNTIFLPRKTILVFQPANSDAMPQVGVLARKLSRLVRSRGRLVLRAPHR